MSKERLGRRGGKDNRRKLAAILTVGALAILGIVGYMSGGGVAGAAYYYYYTTPGPPANLTLTPATATNPVGTTHTVTATVTDSSAALLQDIVVRFTVTGSVSKTGQCTSNASGQCTFTYSGPVLPGADTIAAFADSNGNTTRDAGEPTATSTKTWVLPASTPGSVTGSGAIVASGSSVSFDLSAKSDASGVKGSCAVTVKESKRKIKCTNATVLVVSGNEATFYGDATDDGVATIYAIHVVDSAEPGTADTFSIATASGYSASGALTGGNIQVH